MPVTALYAGLLALLYVVLSARVIFVRRGERISVGDGGNSELLRRVRVHANFAEYVPMAIVLMGLVESSKADPRLLHGLGTALVIGRVSHAIGLSPAASILPLRVGGMVLTFSVIIIAAVQCLLRSAGLVAPAA